MLSLRNLLAPLSFVCPVLALTCLAQDATPQPKLLGSVAFDWNQLAVHKNPKGESRKVC